VYSIVAFAVICLLWVREVIQNRLITEMVVTAYYNSLFHVFVMAVLILGRIQGNDNNEQTRLVPPASLDASAQTVVLSAKLTCFEELFLATIGRIIQLVDLFIWIVSKIGIDLSPFFFPLPFFKFYHARLVTSHYLIRGARIYLNAGFSDAYFLYLQERMLNFLTFTAYTRCKGETYPKCLDSKLQWVGAPPHGYNNHFRIFFNSGTLCERFKYYCQSSILFTFFGWLPFFRPIYLWWHYKQMVQRLVIGGSKATLDDGYSVCAFFGAYLGSCCGCCGHMILVFVDSHIHLQPAGIVAEEGEREMGALFGLTDRPPNSGMGNQSDQVPLETYVLEQSYPVSVCSPPNHRMIDGSLVFPSAGNMGDIDHDLRCHFLQYDISLEGVQKFRNAGVRRLSDFHYIQSADVRNMNMSLLDQRKTETMLKSWHAMHQDALRGPVSLQRSGFLDSVHMRQVEARHEHATAGGQAAQEQEDAALARALRQSEETFLEERERERVRALEQQITPATAANGTHGTLEDACDDLELPETAFPFEENLGASRLHGGKFSC